MKKNLTIFLSAILYLAVSGCGDFEYVLGGPEPIYWPDDMRRNYLFVADYDELTINVTKDDLEKESEEFEGRHMTTYCRDFDDVDKGIDLEFSFRNSRDYYYIEIKELKLIEGSNGEGVTIDMKDVEVSYINSRRDLHFKEKSDVKGWIEIDGWVETEELAPDILSHPRAWNLEIEISVNIEGKDYHIEVLGRDITRANYKN